MALVLVVRARRPFCFGDRVNKIEQIKIEKDGLDVGADISRYAQLGFEAIEEGDLERLKWWGVFFRRHTPGYFMMRIRIPNGITNAVQLSAIGGITDRCGRGFADITTRQQVQLRWIRIGDVPAILDQLRGVGLLTLQTGMDNIRNVVGCPVAGLTPNELLDASPVARAFTETFVGSRAYTNLPRKFNVTITGCRENCTHPETQDLALVRAGADARLPKATDHVGVFRQKQATLNSVGLLVPVGRITGDQLIELARLASSYGTGEVRLTPDQNVIIANVPDAKVGNLTAEPLLKVLRYDPSEIMRGLVSCTGIEFCNLAVIETKSRALAVARALEAKVHNGKPVRVHWSGCPAGCGNHTVADIGLLGTKAKVDGKAVDAVDVFVGGSSGSHATQGIKLLENVPCDALPQVLEGLIRHIDPEKVRRQLRSLSPTPAAGAPTADTEATPVISPDALAEGAGRLLTVHGVEVAVFRCQNRIHAIQNRCPHEGGALSGGTLDGGDVICPLHGYRFNLETGSVEHAPVSRLKRYPCRGQITSPPSRVPPDKAPPSCGHRFWIAWMRF